MHGFEGQVQRTLDRNNKCSALKFSHELAHDGIDFLDTTVFRSKGYMAVKPHFKVTNRFLYLLVGSNHPCSMGKGVFTGELIRIRRSSTLDHHYEAAAERPKQAFRARVYKRSIFHLSDPYTRNGCAGNVCWSNWHGFGLFL